ncbi:MAG TPA: hypothetical protein VG893_16680 [Terracidiphilus sp.]|nr:hypothetical protein [Terracidiphilus sp.]
MLDHLSFGQQVAEEEVKNLGKYFVETEQWRSISSGAIDIVYGPKGAGKSALYALLLDRSDFFFDQSILMVSGENPRGATVFNDLVNDPPTSEREFIELWKLYFLVLVADVLRQFAPGHSATKTLVHFLEGAGLLSEQKKLTLTAVLRAVYDYVRHGPESIESELKLDPLTGVPAGVSGKITFREPSAADSRAGAISVNALFDTAEEALAETPLTVWILMDRLDVAFAESAELEANALRALFKAYLDLLGKDHIRLKIFLRTDIWRRITRDQGFREASHITRSTIIQWDKASLVNLVARRAAQSPELLEYCGLPLGPQIDNESQKTLFDVLFPDQVEIGPNKPKTFDWILGRTSDGTGQNAPRELIHFLNATRNGELSRLDLGSTDENESVFSRSAIKNALPEVSTVRLERTLFAEYPELRKFIVSLEQEKTLQRPDTLAQIWGLSQLEAGKIAEELAEVGFFEKRGTKEAPEYWVPFLYRSALKMIQGAAD